MKLYIDLRNNVFIKFVYYNICNKKKIFYTIYYHYFPVYNLYIITDMEPTEYFMNIFIFLMVALYTSQFRFRRAERMRRGLLPTTIVRPIRRRLSPPLVRNVRPRLDEEPVSYTHL